MIFCACRRRYLAARGTMDWSKNLEVGVRQKLRETAEYSLPSERLAKSVNLDLDLRVNRALTPEEQRSLAYHRAVVEKLLHDPKGVIEHARSRTDEVLVIGSQTIHASVNRAFAEAQARRSGSVRGVGYLFKAFPLVRGTICPLAG